MFEAANYAQPLRAIGQALELLNVESFDMEPDGEDTFSFEEKQLYLGILLNSHRKKTKSGIFGEFFPAREP